MPGCGDHRCARRAGVRKAPRQEIAGCGAPTVQRALWGFGVGESVGEVEARLAIGSLKVESWACVLARTSGSHVVRQDLRCHHGPVLLIGASGGASGREPARMARFGAVRGGSAAGASEVSFCSERTGTASSWRARAMLAARVPLASSP